MAKQKEYKISKEQIIKMERSIRRDEDIQNGMNVCHHRVHESKKAYKRNQKHKGSEI